MHHKIMHKFHAFTYACDVATHYQLAQGLTPAAASLNSGKVDFGRPNSSMRQAWFYYAAIAPWLMQSALAKL